MAALSKHDLECVDKAVAFMAARVAAERKLPSREELREHLGTGTVNAQKIRQHIIENKLVPIPPEDASDPQSDTVEKEKRTINIPASRIHTLEQLIQAFEIDTTVWECERFIANKWEVGMKLAATTEYYTAKGGREVPGWVRHSDETIIEPLYQVKAIFKRLYTLKEADRLAEDNARLLRQLARQKVDSSVNKRYATLLARNHVGGDDLLAEVKEFVNTFGDFSLPYDKFSAIPKPAIKPGVREGHSEDAVLLLSDQHYGDQIRREDTSGFPEYNLIIGGNRTGYVIGKAKQCLTIHRAFYPIRKLYVWVGGDVGNGILHDSPNSNKLFTPAQVHFSYHMLKFCIEDLLQLTAPDENGVQVVEEIVLLFSVGNHMRLDEKMPHKFQAQRTLDWLIYQFIIERFTGHPKVRIRTEMSPYIFENIRGWRYLFAHGMQVGYRNNPEAQNKAVGGFMTVIRSLFDSPEWRKKNGLQGETFSRICIGDIHVPLSFPRFKSNGSLNGQNELGVNWGLEPIPAGQQLFGVSDKHQETWAYFLNCSHVQQEKEDFNNYGIFAAEYDRRIGR